MKIQPCRAAIAVAACLFVCACSDSTDCMRGNPLMPACISTATQPLSPGTRVVFQSTMDGDPEIYSMNSDGTGLMRLTTSPGLDGQPRWSPDGAKIAFASNRGGTASEIWVMNSDGTAPRKLTTIGATSFNPDWSPDGARIAFQSSRGDGNWDIYVMDADGANLQRVTSANSQICPRWSPDGNRLAVQWFASTAQCTCVLIPPLCPCNGRIALMNPDGTGLTLLPQLGADDSWPEWSPDGRRLLLASYRAASEAAPERSRIMVMDVDGGQPRTLTATVMEDWNPVWSRSSGRIYFVRGQSNISSQVYSMNADGTDVGRVSAHLGRDITVHSR